jgi:hypothetical protein
VARRSIGGMLSLRAKHRPARVEFKSGDYQLHHVAQNFGGLGGRRRLSTGTCGISLVAAIVRSGLTAGRLSGRIPSGSSGPAFRGRPRPQIISADM